MSAGEITGLLVALAAVIGSVVAWRKFGPERNNITVTSADKVNAMTLRFAGAVDKDNEGLREDLDQLRAEFAQYRKDADARMLELTTELRGERAEKRQLATENEALMARVTKAEKRVDELEAEVRALKADRT